MEDNPNLEKFENTLTEENYTQAQAELSKLEKNFDKNFYFLEANGRFCVATGKINEAFQNYRGALKVAGETSSVRKDVLIRIYINCSDISQKLGNPEQAKAYLEKGLQFEPEHFLLTFNLAVAQLNSGEELKAAKNFEKCSKINQNSMETWYNFGLALLKIRNFDNAIKAFNRALEINPEYIAALNNRGNAKKHLRKTSAAILDYSEALKIDPDYLPSLKNISSCYEVKKDYIRCLGALRRVATLEPTSFDVLCKIIYLERQICDWSRAQDRVEVLTKKIIELSEKDHSRPAPSTFSLLNLIDDPEFHLRATRNYTREKVGTLLRDPFLDYKKPTGRKKIKVGYFSADFHDHATMHLMIKALEAHDKKKFEITAFSFGPELKDDPYQTRVKNCVHTFYNVSGMSDIDIANLGRKLKLDIAVDLKGHTTDCRPKIFAFGAAPIQISYLGFPGTLGDKNIDFIIGDEFVTPLEHEKYYTEKIIQMPHSYQVNDNTKKISKKKFTKKQEGLPENGFVFCCFNNNYKISPDEFDIWCRILTKVPDSVLWLFESNEIASSNLKKEAEKRGVKSDRIIFAERRPIAEHLARHKLADLFLDTFFYNAHTTCSDALWSGVPVITKMGTSFPARVGASLLSAAGLGELVTKTNEEYENLALELALNPKKLAKIKSQLTKNKAKKPLFDTEKFVRDLEKSYISCVKNA